VPYQIRGERGTFYEPGERKGNAYILWRGRDDVGRKLEIITDARDPKGAAAYVRAHLAERARRTPPAARTPGVTLATANLHYRAERGLNKNDDHPDVRRLDFIVGRDGRTELVDINNATIKATAEAWLEMRRGQVARALAMSDKERTAAKINKGSLKAPSWATANREVVTPYRALLHYAVEQEWRHDIRVKSLRPPEGALPPAPPIIAEDSTVLKLLEAIERRIERAPTAWTRDKNLLKRAFVWLVHERGYRVSEWMRLDWSWLELPKARGRIAITKKKGEPRWEEFELSPTAVAFLAALGPRDEGRVFPWHSRSNIYRFADELIGPDLKWRPHESRRAIVSHIVAETGDYKQAGRYVGHGSERTTFRYRILRRAELAPTVRFQSRSSQ
jgi:hypothetical protein